MGDTFLRFLSYIIHKNFTLSNKHFEEKKIFVKTLEE